MTDPDYDKVYETFTRLPFGPTEDNLPLCDPTGKTIKRNVSSAISGNPYAPLGSESQAIRNASCEAQNLNIANAALARRGQVTMGQPLKAWGAPDSFHRTLALHIDTVTFAACGKGILDDDNLSPWVWYPVCALLLLMFGLIVWRFA